MDDLRRLSNMSIEICFNVLYINYMKKFIHPFLILSIFILTSQTSLAKEFNGVGISFEKNNNSPYPIVKGVVENSSAEKALIQPGDVILKINDEDTSEMSILSILTAIKGPKCTCVNILVQRNCEKTLYTLKRCPIKMPLYHHNLMCYE